MVRSLILALILVSCAQEAPVGPWGACEAPGMEWSGNTAVVCFDGAHVEYTGEYVADIYRQSSREWCTLYRLCLWQEQEECEEYMERLYMRDSVSYWRTIAAYPHKDSFCYDKKQYITGG